MEDSSIQSRIIPRFAAHPCSLTEREACRATVSAGVRNANRAADEQHRAVRAANRAVCAAATREMVVAGGNSKLAEKHFAFQHHAFLICFVPMPRQLRSGL